LIRGQLFGGFMPGMRYMLITILMLAGGAGIAPAQTASFSGVQSTIGTGLMKPFGVAVDGSGNVYISDISSDTVFKETLSNNSYTQSTITSGLSINSPNSVAVDGSGNVYIANTKNNNVLKETLSNGSYTQSIIIGSLNSPNGVAVDSSGNVYIADTNGGSGTGSILIETPSSGGSYMQSTLSGATGLSFPQGVAVDGSGNVYIANSGDSSILLETPVSGTPGTYTQSTIVSTGLNNPVGLAVDGSGSVYIADQGGSLVLKESPLFGGGYMQSTIGTGLGSPESVAVDGSGNVYIADSTVGALKAQDAGVNFGTAAIATSTPTMVTLPFSFETGGAIATPVVVTLGGTKNAQGASLDFADAGTGSCDTTPSQSMGSTCTVNVTFTPTAAGTRYGAVTLLNSSGNVIATAFVFGTGQGPQINFLPGTQSMIGTGLNAPVGVAVDGSGNVYIADSSNARVLKEALSGGVYTQSTIGTGLVQPFGVAVDGSGNVYITDIGNDTVLLETLSGGTYTQSKITSGVSINSPNGVAVDSSGNVYIANTNNSNVLKETLSNGIYTQSIIVGSLNSPNGVAVDSSGNVYIADTNGGSGTGSILIETPSSGGSYTQSTLSEATGLSFPQGVAVDGSGNVYIADSNNARVLKETLSGGTYTQSTIPATALDQPKGVAVDGSGNVYIANNGSSVVLKEDFADASTLTFATPTDDGTTDATDGALSVQIENIGNQTLTAIAPGLSVAPNFMQVAGSGTPTDCMATFSLVANASCNISVEFEPVAPATGTVNGSVMLVDNNLNVTPSTTQTIPLIGTAVAVGTIAISPATLPAATIGTMYSQTLTAGGGTSPYTFAISAGALPAGITLTGGVLAGTPTGVGTFTFTVTATDSSPAPGPLTGTAKYVLTVNPVAAPTITITPAMLTAGTVGTAYSQTLTASGGTSPYTFAVTSGALPGGITLTGGVLAGTPTAVGTFTFTVTATDSSPAPGPYTGTAMYRLTVNAVASSNFAFTTTGASTATVSPGMAAMYSFSLAPPSGGNYPGTVSFTVTGLPTGATTSFGPFTVAASAGASTVTMTVQTAGAMAQNHLSPIGRGFVLALLLLPFGMMRSLRKKLNGRMLLLLLLLVGTTAAMSGCGSNKSSNGSSSMQSAQTYTLTVTATSGALTQSQTVMLTVQ
jgi:DNA-binding beta-propeller fold protein YncE